MEKPAKAPAIVDQLLPIGGFILAGGRSTRMGTDKALLQLAGRTLIQHAVTKLRSFCADVHILGSNPALASYAPLIPDIHPGCGPLGGIEAALLHSAYDWNLILPVDVPFIPTVLLRSHAIVNAALTPPFVRRVEMFTLNGRPQPAVCFLHREIAPYITSAIERGDLKLLPALEAAGQALAIKQNQPLRQVLHNTQISSDHSSAASGAVTDAQEAAMHLWFSNINTPEDFMDAEAHTGALDI